MLLTASTPGFATRPQAESIAMFGSDTSLVGLICTTCLHFMTPVTLRNFVDTFKQNGMICCSTCAKRLLAIGFNDPDEDIGTEIQTLLESMSHPFTAVQLNIYPSTQVRHEARPEAVVNGILGAGPASLIHSERLYSHLDYMSGFNSEMWKQQSDLQKLLCRLPVELLSTNGVCRPSRRMVASSRALTFLSKNRDCSPLPSPC